MPLIRSVQKSIRIVETVATAESGLTATEIAAALDLPVPTAHHLLGTLVVEGVLARNGRRYSLGPKALALAAAVGPPAAAPISLRIPLRQLAEETGETAYLSDWRSGGALVLETVEGMHAVRVSSLSEGYRDFSHARAAGKALLAFGPPGRLTSYLAEVDWGGPTAKSIVTEAALRADLAKVRAAGLAFDREEFSEGALGVAAPVVHDGIAVAAFGITAPADRFRRHEGEYEAAVLAAAAKPASRQRLRPSRSGSGAS